MKKSSLMTAMIFAGLVAGSAYANNGHGNGQLPPGLQKNVNRGQPLPPGWQKRLSRGQIIERSVYEHGQIVKPLDSRGLITLRLDGKLVRLYAATREIVDVMN